MHQNAPFCTQYYVHTSRQQPVLWDVAHVATESGVLHLSVAFVWFDVGKTLAQLSAWKCVTKGRPPWLRGANQTSLEATAMPENAQKPSNTSPKLLHSNLFPCGGKFCWNSVSLAPFQSAGMCLLSRTWSSQPHSIATTWHAKICETSHYGSWQALSIPR